MLCICIHISRVTTIPTFMHTTCAHHMIDKSFWWILCSTVYVFPFYSNFAIFLHCFNQFFFFFQMQYSQLHLVCTQSRQILPRLPIQPSLWKMNKARKRRRGGEEKMQWKNVLNGRLSSSVWKYVYPAHLVH